MAKNKTKDTASQKAVGDSFQNFVANVGLGTNNQISGGNYNADYWTRNRTELEFAYRTSWIIGQAVDVPAEDMTREGVEFKTSKLKPDQLEKLRRSCMRLNIWPAICDTVKWSRLFGGCIAVMMIDGQDVSKPLRPETVTKEAFRGLLVLDRWVVNPSLSDLVTDFGPDIGLPKYYTVNADAQYLPTMRIHHSRVLRFEGIKLPYYQRLTELLWGESVLERIHDRLVAYDSATMGIAQLMFKAHLRIFSVENLRELLAAGGTAYKGLVEQVKTMRLFQSNEGITLIDSKDKFEALQYTFSGTGDVLLQLAQQLSGALQIPLVRLLGQSPAGLNSTGESDLKTYYDGITRLQEANMRRPLSRLFNIIVRSELGSEPPEDFWFDFKPLWQLSDSDKADVALKETQAIMQPYEAGVTDKKTTLHELKTSGESTGLWTNITDEVIAEAEDEPPLSGFEEPEEEPNAEGKDPIPKTEK